MDEGNLWDSKEQILNYSEEILNSLVASKLLKSNSNDKNECAMENLQRQVEFYVSKKNFKRNSQFFETLKSQFSTQGNSIQFSQFSAILWNLRSSKIKFWR